MFFRIVIILSVILLVPSLVQAKDIGSDDRKTIIQAALDYIESQHKPDSGRMDRALHPELQKRTYWYKADGTEYVMETSRDTMIWVAENYNKDGNKFPTRPRKEIRILDLDNRVASVKLTTDDWIDYMHLIKDDQGQWTVINVLWQYHDETRHGSK